MKARETVNDDAAKLEAGKRWMELVKLLAAQAEAAERRDKPALYLRIAGVYHDRFSNMAEAIKAYERVLEYEPDNRHSLDHLRALFEKRRDWEKLLELEKGELDRTEPAKRRDKAVEIARMAAAHVGKPDVTIYWWQRVLEYEPDHRHALAELAKSFERAGRVMDLASVLQQQVESAQGNDDRIAALRRLATVREDMLADLEAARSAWRHVLDLDAKDVEARRAIERLDAASEPPPSVAVEKLARAPVAVEKASNEKTSPVDRAAASSTTPHPDPDQPAPAITIMIAVVMLAIAGGVIYFVTR